MTSSLWSRRRIELLVAGAILGLTVAAQPAVAAKPATEKPSAGKKAGIHRAANARAVKVAGQVDRLLAEIADSDSAEAMPPADDATWLRRVYLDLIGELPTPEETVAFVDDASPRKRPRQVHRLLQDRRYAENWARYWRDVMLYRRSDERALLAADSVTQYLSDQFQRGASWQEIARELVTATGELRTDGRTALIASQWGEVPETAAEVSRVLMGVQIQCAQCHDHKTDRWTREQFHELAAFFPRIGMRAVFDDDGRRRGFEVIAKAGPGARPLKNPNAKPSPRFEHFMPDLDDAAAVGTLMEPVFFLTGERLAVGMPDADRRSAIAEWITADSNPWFARAFVNRIWGELIGEGFYEPIDDLGPDRECFAPEALDLLCAEFIANDYDLRWLLRTIVSTEVYSRGSRPRSDGQRFEATCPQPLRADQIYNNLAAALDLSAPVERRRPPRRPGARDLSDPREMFQASFGFDPSDPRDEHTTSIDQALVLMNAPVVARGISARPSRAQSGGTLLSRLLEDPDDDAVLRSLYLRMFAREPKPSEMETCRAYLAEVADREEGFEDILWSLVNSTEFLYRD